MLTSYLWSLLFMWQTLLSNSCWLFVEKILPLSVVRLRIMTLELLSYNIYLVIYSCTHSFYIGLLLLHTSRALAFEMACFCSLIFLALLLMFAKWNMFFHVNVNHIRQWLFFCCFFLVCLLLFFFFNSLGVNTDIVSYSWGWFLCEQFIYFFLHWQT